MTTQKALLTDTTEPRLHHFRGGWAASGDGFATFATTREEAIRQFRLHMPAEASSQQAEEAAPESSDSTVREVHEDVSSGRSRGNIPER